MVWRDRVGRFVCLDMSCNSFQLVGGIDTVEVNLIGSEIFSDAGPATTSFSLLYARRDLCFRHAQGYFSIAIPCRRMPDGVRLSAVGCDRAMTLPRRATIKSQI
jgi:hypothetical protein